MKRTHGKLLVCFGLVTALASPSWPQDFDVPPDRLIRDLNLEEPEFAVNRCHDDGIST
jgi:hypothetical protein